MECGDVNMTIIAHLDMDAFFAAVEARVNPQYAGLGIVVGADPKNGAGRGVVSTANYQARKYGIHSALPISTAWKLAQTAEKRGEPKTVFLPVNMSFYSQVSEKIMGIIRKYVPVVEQTSIDEAYLDLSFLAADDLITNSSDSMHLLFEEASEFIIKLKEKIVESEKLTASVGIAPNKLLAKIASGRNKPDGLTVIKPDEVENFLDPLPIGDIPGIGPKTEEFFHKKKIFKVSELRKISQEELASWMGKSGEDIFLKARGIDESEVISEREIKSVSEQETLEKDTLSASILMDKLQKLAERVIERMKSEDIMNFKTVTIVVRFSDFTTKNRTHTLPNIADDAVTLKMESLKLFLPFLDRRQNPKLQLIRLIGVGVENFKGETDESKQNLNKSEIVIQANLF